MNGRMLYTKLQTREKQHSKQPQQRKNQHKINKYNHNQALVPNILETAQSQPYVFLFITLSQEQIA